MRKLSIQEEKNCNPLITKDHVCNEALNVNIENKEVTGKKRADIEISVDNVRTKIMQNHFFLLYKIVKCVFSVTGKTSQKSYFSV